MIKSVDFPTLIKAVKVCVDEEIEAICDEFDVDERVRPLLVRGKRLRSAVLCLPLAHGQMTGTDFDEYHLTPQAYTLAAAIEIAHAASLIMDDVIDEDPTRRGQPTLHTKIGRDKALMNSVGLLAIPYEIASMNGPYFVKSLGETQRSMVKGIVTEMFKHPDLPAMALYDAIVTRKTGTLFSLAATWGYHAYCLAGGKAVNVITRERWREYGRLLGIVMQVADDIADLRDADAGKKPLGTGSESVLLRALSLDTLAKELVRDLKTRDFHLEKIHLTYSDEGILHGLITRLQRDISRAEEEAAYIYPVDCLLVDTPTEIAAMMLEEE